MQNPDKTLVEIWVYRARDCTWVRAWVTLREAWITHQPGLIPPPGCHKEGIGGF